VRTGLNRLWSGPGVGCLQIRVVELTRVAELAIPQVAQLNRQLHCLDRAAIQCKHRHAAGSRVMQHTCHQIFELRVSGDSVAIRLYQREARVRDQTGPLAQRGGRFISVISAPPTIRASSKL
jgi:hypothetical protein